MNYEFSTKKTIYLTLIVSGILAIVTIGTITYFAWPKNKPVENKPTTGSKEQIQNLKTQLNSLKSKLKNVSDNTKKTQLENKLTGIENQIKNLSSQTNSPSLPTIKKLEQEVKEIDKAIESNDNPNEDDDPDENPEPTNRNKAKAKFVGKSLKDQDSGEFDNYKFLDTDQSGHTKNIFYISKNHPQIKQLLSQNKLQKDKYFTVRYGKIDSRCHLPSDDDGFLFTFNENNQELEIIEVGNPNPQPENKGLNYVATKINDNTYKYKITLNNGSEIDFANFIIFLKTKDKEFFAAFQGALKDANSKFPAYFWKCPPVSHKTLGKTFELVVIKSETLNNIQQNYSSFQEHFGKSQDNQVVSFSSPSGNLLVCPVPKGTADYKNISQFTKNAPLEQQQALWKEVADKLIKELKKDADAPRWLNTEGTGVPYLHVRIDKTPKFYSNYPEYAK
ncbi:MAG: hypothetical protein I3273_06620 [Candidatus Moeniiplasma glomeromycotorum]|nr:hypothetical protein [Candidatus Moeniiplasma glomeromycotorum]MCE8168225.1 hypothetical protein [Candidatus Moeniiplasma glomeromycotorum]MCE8169758.1 hypothetical protein [Candidatus Moeniiplasma glomeromycotorum]